jgi:hypothetical protein
VESRGGLVVLEDVHQHRGDGIEQERPDDQDHQPPAQEAIGVRLTAHDHAQLVAHAAHPGLRHAPRRRHVETVREPAADSV